MCKNELNIYCFSNIKVQRVNCEVVVSDKGDILKILTMKLNKLFHSYIYFIFCRRNIYLLIV